MASNLNTTQTNQSCKNLVIDIIKYYQSKELDSVSEYKYYTIESYDDVLLPFEKLSNDRNLGIYTKLPIKEATIILLLFSALYDNNYWILFYNKSSNLLELDYQIINLESYVDSLDEIDSTDPTDPTDPTENLSYGPTITYINKPESANDSEQNFYRLEDIINLYQVII